MNEILQLLVQLCPVQDVNEGWYTFGKDDISPHGFVELILKMVYPSKFLLVVMPVCRQTILAILTALSNARKPLNLRCGITNFQIGRHHPISLFAAPPAVLSKSREISISPNTCIRSKLFQIVPDTVGNAQQAFVKYSSKPDLILFKQWPLT